MKKIIGIIQPFDIYQTFYVYEDGNKLEIIQTKINDIPKTVLELSAVYDVKQVNLVGAVHFSKGLEKKIKEEELNQYKKNDLIIECI